MPRANRHYVSGHVWHLTHRCHRKQFLLKFVRDRRAWVRWLHAARQRYGLCVLAYTVTSNHIHLLVRDDGRGEIARSMQLIAGRTAQAFNDRKRRHGAYWEDRYHATAVECGTHLARCLVYIDLNMVRAGAVTHPCEWETGSYREIQTPPQRYRIVDRETLSEGLGLSRVTQLADVHSEWTELALRDHSRARMPVWSESLAVGSEEFVTGVASALGIRALHRSVGRCGDALVLREPAGAYSGHFEVENGTLSSQTSRDLT